MVQILTGSLILSLIHASIPNHWITLIAISKTENWSQKQTLWATIITGFAHTLSTVIIGLIVGLVGYKLSSNYELISNTIAPTILLLIGFVYLLLDFKGNHSHSHDESFNVKTNSPKFKSRFIAILASLSIAMFLTPCIEIEAYYFQAGTIGWPGIFTVSLVYTLTTVIVMLLLVYIGLKGIKTFKSHFLEHHEKSVTGLVLIILGLLSLFIKF
jgi:nickel/cobalt transporter (NicO) family protein